MICRCFGKTLDLGALAARARQTADLMVGLPDYDTYVDHVARNHPGETPMTRDAFFRDRQSARYADGSGRGFRCC